MKFEQIKDLIKILDQSNLHELNYRDGEEKLVLKKAPVGEVYSPAPQKNTVEQVPVSEAKQTVSPPKEDNDKKVSVTQENTNLFYVESPLVGTFYRASSPESAPFIEVGTTVKKGDTLCIVEAMKIMNEIPSEVDGVVEAIYIENKHFVEYKTKLLAIRLNS